MRRFLALILAVGSLYGSAVLFQGVTGIETRFILLMTLAGIGGGLVAWMMSSSIAEWSVNAEPYEGELHAVVARLAPRFGLKVTPKLEVYRSATVNALALGSLRDRSRLFVSTALVERLSPEEAELVIAHELAKIASGDASVLLFMQGIISVFAIFPTRYLSLLLGTSLRSAEDETPSDGVERWLKLALEIVLVPGPSLVARIYARVAQAAADRHAAAVMGEARMSAFLAGFEEPQAGAAAREMFTAPHTFAARILRPLRWVSYHAPVALRARRLRFGRA